jgi:hypothetical protein
VNSPQHIKLTCAVTKSSLPVWEGKEMWQSRYDAMNRIYENPWVLVNLENETE